MKSNRWVYLLLPLTFAGCIQSHREPAVVYSSPASYSEPVYTAPPAAVPIAPTSPRPAVRVYPPTSETEVLPPPQPIISYGPSESDFALAENIRRMLSADTGLASASRNMRMTIRDGRVTLTGTAPSENARRLVERTLTNTAGVVSVDDQSQVEFH